MDNDFATIAAAIRERMDGLDSTREYAYAESRAITRTAATAIRQGHRGHREDAEASLAEAASMVRAFLERTSGEALLYGAGFIQDAVKEYVEAAVTLRLQAEEPLPTVEELDVPDPAYLNGVAEAVMELRRHIVDRIRMGSLDEAERKLNRGEDLYAGLMNFDYPDAVTQGLRRRLDTVRSVLERTRSDLVTAIRQSQLEEKLVAVERRLAEM